MLDCIGRGSQNCSQPPPRLAWTERRGPGDYTHMRGADAELWAMLMKDLVLLRHLMLASSACSEARRALGLVKRLRLETAAQCDARISRLFKSVTSVTVCFIRKATLADTLAANPEATADEGVEGETDEHETEDMRARRCNDGAGLGTLEVADELMAEQLPFALSPMPVRTLEFARHWHSEDSTDQVLSAVVKLLMGISSASAAGALPNLHYVGPCGLTMCSLTRPAWRDNAHHRARHPNGSAAAEPLPAAVERVFELERSWPRCLCASLLRGWPMDNLFEAVCLRDRLELCTECSHCLDVMMRRGFDLNARCRLFDMPEWIADVNYADLTMTMGELFSCSPSYFDVAYVRRGKDMVKHSGWQDTDVVYPWEDEVISEMITRGGEVGPALRQAAASGRLRSFLVDGPDDLSDLDEMQMVDRVVNGAM